MRSSFEERLRSTNGPQERILRYLPGLLPSGWQRLSGIVRRDDGVVVAAFAGHGIVVIVESHPARHDIVVSRRGAVVTNDDLERVERELYRRSKLRGRFHPVFDTDRGTVVARISFTE